MLTPMLYLVYQTVIAILYNELKDYGGGKNQGLQSSFQVFSMALRSLHKGAQFNEGCTSHGLSYWYNSVSIELFKKFTTLSISIYLSEAQT